MHSYGPSQEAAIMGNAMMSAGPYSYGPLNEQYGNFNGHGAVTDGSSKVYTNRTKLRGTVKNGIVWWCAHNDLLKLTSIKGLKSLKGHILPFFKDP